MSTPRRAGIVGTGYIADWHAKAVAATPDVELCAVCDQNESRAQSFAARWGVKSAFGDLHAMLKAEKLDAIHVLTPPGSHVALARDTLEAGVSVLLEKPMGCDAAPCGELVDEARRRGLALGVSHNFLFAEPFERLRADVHAGRLGPLDAVDIVWRRELPAALHGPFGVWFLRDPVAILMEIGAHSIAAMLDLIGEPQTAEVSASRPLRLPTGTTFYRQWHVRAGRGTTAVNLDFSFAPAMDEHRVHVRGGFGAATANLSENTYLLNLGTAWPMDIDRYARVRAMGAQLRRQARDTLACYLGSKCGLSDKGNPFGFSIVQSVREFYRRLQAGEPLDDVSRIGGRFGQRVIAVAQRLMDAARARGFGDVPPPPAPAAATPVPAGPACEQPKTLVLGGTGFIGKHLVRRLVQDGQSVRLLVRNPQAACLDAMCGRVEIIPGDARKLEDLRRACDGVDTVYHLARSECKTLAEYLRDDVEPTRQLGELCVEGGVRRLIYTGTIDSLYLGPGAGTVTESTPLDPCIRRRNNYARSKAMAEAELAALAAQRGLPLVIVRPAIVLGVGSSPCHWGVGMWAGLGICRFWGNADHPLPLVLVDDVAAALAAARDAPGIDGKTYNLSGAPMLTARQYIAQIEKHTGYRIQTAAVGAWRWFAADFAKWIVKVAVRHPDRARVPSLRDWRCREQHAAFDQEAARRDLGWSPCDRVDEFVQRAINAPLDAMLC